MNSKRYPHLLQVAVMIFVVLLAPLIGLVAFSQPLLPYLSFPPATPSISHPEADLEVTAIFSSAIIVAALLFFPRQWSSGSHQQEYRLKGPIPWWTFPAFLALVFTWIIAWNRWEVFSFLQKHTFLLLWISFIALMNGLLCGRTERSPLTHQTGQYLLTFPISAGFWWLFEYLNRFVQNWSYTAVEHYTPFEYFTLASLSFSTVLPAIWVIYLLLSTELTPSSSSKFLLLPLTPSRTSLLCIFTSSVIVLTFLPIYPAYLFSFVWIAPIGVLFSLLHWCSPQSHQMKTQSYFLWALSGLVCGFFWELWNYHSLAKWEYHIPWVEYLYIFEMPLLGYAGYLPFGIFCGMFLHTFSLVHPQSQRVRS